MKILVLDFGGTNLKYALMNEQYEFLEKGSVPAPKNCKEELFSTVNTIYHQYQKQVEGVAISFAGRINAKTGYAYHGGSYQFIKNVELKKEFEELLQCKVTIMNDAECAMIGEHECGNLKGIDNAFAIIIGTGLGGSLLLNGQIYSGSHCNSGEMSSVIVDPHDTNITKYWLGHNTYRGLTVPYEKMHNLPFDSVTGKIFFEDLNDEKIAILRKYCQVMANQIYSIQCFLDVDKFIIGGGISQQKILIDMIREETEKLFDHLKMFQVIAPEICACKFGNDANLVGALVYYMKTINN